MGRSGESGERKRRVDGVGQRVDAVRSMVDKAEGVEAKWTRLGQGLGE